MATPTDTRTHPIYELRMLPRYEGDAGSFELTATLPSRTRVNFRCEGPVRYGTVQVGSTVNWSAIGATEVADVLAFAEALTFAGQLASALGGGS